MNLEKIYQQTILEYSNRKDLKKEIENPTFVERGHNPNCGDDLTLLIREKNNIIEEASFLGNGCAISTASTGMLIDLIVGKDLNEVDKIVNLFFKMMNLNEEDKLSKDEMNIMGDVVLMEYVSKMPARVKCATLSWHSLKVIIEKNKIK